MAVVELELIEVPSFAKEEDVTQPHRAVSSLFSQTPGGRGKDPGSLGKGEGRLLRLWTRTHGGREMLGGNGDPGPHLEEHFGRRGLA